MEPLTVILLVLVGATLLIAIMNALAQRVGVAGPLLLVAVGIVISLLPFVEIPPIPPEAILVAVLPPLLYSAAVNLPSVEFRRDFGPIAGLSVVLVLASALVLGFFFSLVIPGVTLPMGIALGAIVSPTDAVATSIAKRLGISSRVITMLEGESLLNDATALVLLRTAIAAIAGSFSFWSALGAFVWAVLIAVVAGAVVGWLLLRLRAWLGTSAATTAVGFTVPFLAYFPAEQLGASGLVAAVTAGIVAGQGSRRLLSAEQRLNDTTNWHTVELLLESAVFLVMGLELRDIITGSTALTGLPPAILIAVAALAILLLVRAAYVTVIVWSRRRRTARADRERLTRFGDRLDAVADGSVALPAVRRGPGSDPARIRRRAETMRVRVNQMIASIDYYRAQPLSWRHGTVIVWAGMRGVVTLAAAQTLPRDGIEHRPLLILIAFLVALISLLVQGLTLSWGVHRLGLAGPGDEEVSRRERAQLDEQLRQAAASGLTDPHLTRHDGAPFDAALVARLADRVSTPPADEDNEDLLELRLAAITAMRRRLDELSRDGTYGTAMLRHMRAQLDADELSLQLRLGDS